MAKGEAQKITSHCRIPAAGTDKALTRTRCKTHSIIIHSNGAKHGTSYPKLLHIYPESVKKLQENAALISLTFCFLFRKIATYTCKKKITRQGQKMKRFILEKSNDKFYAFRSGPALIGWPWSQPPYQPEQQNQKGDS